MIEKTVIDFLSDNLEVPVYMEVPENPPEKYVVVEKTGSGCENHIYTAMFAVQSIANTLYEAAELNEVVKCTMDDLILLPEVTHAELNSDYNYTDTQTKKYRYQAVYDITHY